MAHALKPDIVFRRNGRVHLNRRGASVQSTTGSRCVRISGSNAGYTMFRGSVKSTGYPLHSPVSPSLPPPVRHHVPLHFNWSLRYESPPHPSQYSGSCENLSAEIGFVLLIVFLLFSAEEYSKCYGNI